MAWETWAMRIEAGGGQELGDHTPAGKLSGFRGPGVYVRGDSLGQVVALALEALQVAPRAHEGQARVWYCVLCDGELVGSGSTYPGDFAALADELRAGGWVTTL